MKKLLFVFLLCILILPFEAGSIRYDPNAPTIWEGADGKTYKRSGCVIAPLDWWEEQEKPKDVFNPCPFGNCFSPTNIDIFRTDLDQFIFKMPWWWQTQGWSPWTNSWFRPWMNHPYFGSPRLPF